MLVAGKPGCLIYLLFLRWLGEFNDCPLQKRIK